MVNYIIVQVGQGAGKDLIAAIIAARIGYLLCCCESPQDAFGMPKAAKIHLLNCAASPPQASEVYFAYLVGLVSVEDGWFGRWFESRPKHERAGCLARSIGFGQNVIALSGHSDAATQQGLNLLVAVADEIDEFLDDDVWNMAVSSAPSRFPREHKLIALSWPRHHGSKIQQLTWRGRELGAEGGFHVIGPASTFHVNPTKTEADFTRFAAQNPALYRARYLCRPQLSSNPLFPNDSIISACLTPESRPRVRVVRYEREGAAWRPVWEISHELLIPYAGVCYHLHIDAS